jgi:hypothetical protein
MRCWQEYKTENIQKKGKKKVNGYRYSRCKEVTQKLYGKLFAGTNEIDNA